MLRRWSKRAAVIAIGAEGIALRPGNRGETTVRQLVANEEGRQVQYLLDQLQQMSASLDLSRVRFALANQFARYIVIPWQNGLHVRQDWHALAVSEFRKQFGAVSERWDVRVALQGYGSAVVACALDRELVERLLTLSGEAGWTVETMEPMLMTVFNSFRKQLAGTDCWLLLAEPGRLLLAQFSGHAWQHFYTESPLPGQESSAARQLLERVLRTQSNVPPKAVACFGPAAMLPDPMPEGIALLKLQHLPTGVSRYAVYPGAMEVLAGLA